MKKEVPVQPIVYQYRYEAESWNRLLMFLRDELVAFKNRLSEIINGSAEDEQLSETERFQEAFIEQDRIIEYLSSEVKHQLRLIGHQGFLTDEGLRELQLAQDKLRLEMRKEEELFVQARSRFVQYLNDLVTDSFIDT